MKRLLLPLSALLLLSAPAVEVDGIAARVGASVILRSEVVTEMRRQNARSDRYEAVRDEMVERALILQAAAAAKMQMQEWVVENRIRDIIGRAFGGDRNQLLAVLANDKVSYAEWHQRMRDDMIVGAMRWQIVDKNVTATPSAMRAEYAGHPERYASEHRVTVSAILLGPNDAEKKSEIDEALKTESFADLAKRYSADAHAKEGGQWKDVKPEEVFRPEICAEIARMKVGETSKWIALDGWSFLLRKDAEAQGSRLSYAEAYDRIAANVKEAAAKRLYDEWIARLKAETYVKLY